MNWVEKIAAAFVLWIDVVARTVGAPLERLRSARRIDVVEDDDGRFTVRLAHATEGRRDALAPQRVGIVDGAIDGALAPGWAAAFRDSRVELVLQSSRFLFRPLELPKRAGEFLDGIVRAQIDRLTPWNASEASFHWTRPDEIAGERIVLTVAATARTVTTSFARAFSALGAAAVDVSTVVPGANAVKVTVMRQRVGGTAEFARVRVALLAGFFATGLLWAMSTAASEVLVGHYDDEIQQIQHRIAARRALIRTGNSAIASSAVELLERRKQTTPSSVIVIEALSALLPDHTFATEVRIEGDKLQIVGITRDAPSLIELLEQSPHFTGATFFAPTTRAPNEAGERFHIEARIKPYFRMGA